MTDILYSDVATKYPDQVDNDSFAGKQYNGRKTIHAKALLAKSYGAGIMIWEMGQDVTGVNSLLQQIKSAQVTVSGSRNNTKAN